MTDRCETCGWWDAEDPDESVECSEEPVFGFCTLNPRPEVKNGHQRCAQHTAVQHRRDRLALAGQAMVPLLESSDALPDDALPVLWKTVADQAFAQADAILAKAERITDT